MGCSFSAIHDDEMDWDRFKNDADIKNVTYNCYSDSAVYAREGFYKYGYKGTRLKLYVHHQD